MDPRLCDVQPGALVRLIEVALTLIVPRLSYFLVVQTLH